MTRPAYRAAYFDIVMNMVVDMQDFEKESIGM